VVSSWNAGARRIKGYEAHEVIGSHFSRFYVEDDRAAGLPSRALATARAEGRFEMEGWRQRKDGSVFWANVVIDCIRDSDGHVVGFAKITRDITERRNAQLAVAEAERRASQSQKMEALGHLTGGVAHDFNNLMMIISGQSQMLRRLAGDDPKARRAAEAIDTAIGRGSSLTRQLLTFSRRQTLSPRAIDVAEQVEAFRSMVTATMGGFTILTAVPPGTWTIAADPNELEIALLNLAINARDAMPQGGSITITAENTVLPATSPDDQGGEFVALSVADTGTGIAPDILPKIFDPFFTTKQEHKGSGLGLSQVHGFAHQSQGKVTIDSELGKGTRVTLYLPRARSAEAAADSEAAGPLHGRGTILVVDDNPDVGEATGAMLGELGYDVVLANDAAAALAEVARRKPLLVLSDIVMPGDKDGVALARELRALYPDLPIVLTTGYSRNMPADGEFPVLRKPSGLAELGRTIRSMLATKNPSGDNLIQLRRPGERGPAGQ
jgi:PAS domain S-box-containing protein